MKYFEVTVEVEVATLKNGNPKLKKEIYLVDAQSVTEAEQEQLRILKIQVFKSLTK